MDNEPSNPSSPSKQLNELIKSRKHKIEKGTEKKYKSRFLLNNNPSELICTTSTTKNDNNINNNNNFVNGLKFNKSSTKPKNIIKIRNIKK